MKETTLKEKGLNAEERELRDRAQEECWKRVFRKVKEDTPEFNDLQVAEFLLRMEKENLDTLMRIEGGEWGKILMSLGGSK